MTRLQGGGIYSKIRNLSISASFCKVISRNLWKRFKVSYPLAAGCAPEQTLSQLCGQQKVWAQTGATKTPKKKKRSVEPTSRVNDMLHLCCFLGYITLHVLMCLSSDVSFYVCAFTHFSPESRDALSLFHFAFFKSTSCFPSNLLPKAKTL